MRVVLLGSGAADGWPNAFCRCPSCAAQRGAGVLRASTSALADERLLLDLGPDVPRQAERLGCDLSAVTTVLVTHDHPDHLAPEVLLWRRWATTSPATQVTVAGPTAVTDEVERWFGGDPLVATVPLDAGDEVLLDGFAVRALAARHEVPTLLYDVTGPDAGRLLYATDTGPLPPATLDSVAGAGYGLVLLEQTFGNMAEHGTDHHDLPAFASTVDGLRERGAVTDRTAVAAVHLSHHNPPEPDLAHALAASRAVPGRDGQRWQVPATGHPTLAPTEAATEAGSPAGAPAGAPTGAPPESARRTLLLGGARSGKSRAAERMLESTPVVVYVATGGTREQDAEWRARVAAHRARRPPTWTTLETTDLATALREQGPPLLVDCLTLWLTAQLDEVGAWDQGTWRATGSTALAGRVDDLVDAWRRTPRRVVGVSNEVGSGVVPDTWSGRLFRDEMGRLNARLADASDRVSLVVAGLETRLR